jgi:putative ABC transport system substrate-binding protein
MPEIGFLHAGSPKGSNMAAFRQGLAEGGYDEGRDVAIELRFAEGKSERLPALATDLVQRRVAVIVTDGTTSRLAAKASDCAP